MPEFKLKRGGLQDQFLGLRTKIQIFGGGFGNGKTTGVIGKVLPLTQDYPGANILMARSTYPKLNDTLRKEFLKWCPKDWIKSFPMSVNASNLCTLTNGTTLPFRYIAQQGKTEESSTSNLLSATYDLIVVDQMEDPEISYKDFLDLMGRLRGNTLYRGNDPTMPRSGPRWMFLTVNPTRNWVYQELVAPYHAYINEGRVTDKLLCIRDNEMKPVLLNGKPQLLIEIVEGSTYENRHNVEHDFIQGMESTYRGQQRDRYLLGKWAAYEGLVYPQFDETQHLVGEKAIKRYLDQLIEDGYEISWEEGYDYGIAAPSCYLLAFVDPHGNVVVADGFYKREFPLEDTDKDGEGQWTTIKKIREKWGADTNNVIQADPQIFRRVQGKGTGTTVADLFWSDAGLLVSRAANDIIHGITKVGAYLNPRNGWINPFTLTYPAPSIYFNEKLSFITDEMGSYFWKKNPVTGDREDMPQDGNDHGLDTTKFLLTRRPEASKLRRLAIPTVPLWMRWNEAESKELRSRRHG